MQRVHVKTGHGEGQAGGGVLTTGYEPHDAHLLLILNAYFYHSALLKVFLFGNE